MHGIGIARRERSELFHRHVEHVFKKMYREDSFSEQGGRCRYCESRLSRGEATADHLIPVIRGGQTTRANIRVSCRTCNIAKGSLGEMAFRNLMRAEAPPPLHQSERVKAWIAHRINRAVKKVERRICRFVGMPQV